VNLKLTLCSHVQEVYILEKKHIGISFASILEFTALFISVKPTPKNSSISVIKKFNINSKSHPMLLQVLKVYIIFLSGIGIFWEQCQVRVKYFLEQSYTKLCNIKLLAYFYMWRQHYHKEMMRGLELFLNPFTKISLPLFSLIQWFIVWKIFFYTSSRDIQEEFLTPIYVDFFHAKKIERHYSTNINMFKPIKDFNVVNVKCWI